MRRLTLTLLLVVLVAIFGLGFLLDSVFEKYLSAKGPDLSQIQSLAKGIAITLNQAESPVRIVDNWPQSAHYAIAIENKSALPVPATLLGEFESGGPLLLETDAGISLYFYLSNHEGVLAVQAGELPGNKSRGLALMFTGLFYLGTLLLVLLWLKPLLSRLNMLRDAARFFGAGELASRVNTHGYSYIRDIENDFNGMADKIQQLIDDNKLLSSAVSHDLRTPLARLRFGIDTLAETESSDCSAQYLARINNDLNEMESLVDSLLRYAKLDNVMEGMHKQSVSLRQLLHECSAQYYDNRIVVRIDESELSPADDLIVEGCIEHLAMLFNNLIQNAVDHADSELLVVLSGAEKYVQIAFSDDGPGIPPAFREQVMKPFQRGHEGGKGIANSGYGLGLAVVERVASYHGATVMIQGCKRLGGASISVRFSR